MKGQLNLLRRLGVPFLIFGVWLSWFFVWGTPATRDRPVVMLECVFEAFEDQSPIRLGRYVAPIETLSIEGGLSASFDDTLYKIDGSARYVIEGRAVTSDVTGSVFLGSEFEPKALAVNIRDANFGRGGLRVYTADETGQLNDSSDRAYAFTDKAHRLAHPMRMHCSTHPPKDNGLLDGLRN